MSTFTISIINESIIQLQSIFGFLSLALSELVKSKSVWIIPFLIFKILFVRRRDVIPSFFEIIEA